MTPNFRDALKIVPFLWILSLGRQRKYRPSGEETYVIHIKLKL
jgi:hypothetical protein